MLFIYRRTNEICANPFLDLECSGLDGFQNPLFNQELPSAQPNPSFGLPGLDQQFNYQSLICTSRLTPNENIFVRVMRREL